MRKEKNTKESISEPNENL
uniref:Uncharacterized protein n=1 Tax=Rhizophora mucronata TaxID=61149 RepID=A0A2P2PPN7_RHIMU